MSGYGEIDPARATIGALLLLPLEDVRAVLAAVHDDDPEDPRLRRLLGAIRALADQGARPDPVRVLDYLRSAGGVTRDGLPGLQLMLAELVAPECVPIPRAVPAYAAALVQEAVRRRVAEAAQALAEVAESGSVDDVATIAERESVAAVLAAGRLSAAVPLGVSA
jgi:replicative DNA helicase